MSDWSDPSTIWLLRHGQSQGNVVRDAAAGKPIEELDIPPIPEFIELISDSGGGLYGCKASVDMFGFTMDDFVPQVDSVITIGEFYEQAAGAQIVFT